MSKPQINILTQFDFVFVLKTKQNKQNKDFGLQNILEK